MKRILILMTLILVLYPFQSYSVHAEDSKWEEFVKHKTFLKSYQEFLADFSLKVASSYADRDENYDQFVQQISDSLPDIFPDEGYFNDEAIPSMLYAFEFPVKLLGAFNDVTKDIWDKIKDYFSGTTNPIIDNIGTHPNTYHPPDGYAVKLNGSDRLYKSVNIGSYGNGTSCPAMTVHFGASIQGDDTGFTNIDKSICDIPGLTKEDYWEWRDYSPLYGIAKIYDAYRLVNRPIDFTIVRVSDETIIDPFLTDERLTNIYNNTVNNFNDGNRIDENYSPNITPFLSCPNENVDLEINDGVWYTKERTRSLVTIIINADGKAIYNNEECNLDFKFPNIEVHVNGDVTSDGESIIRTPGEGESVPPSEELDDTLLGYIRNAYEFATQTINTGVEGLKSIVLGTSGLIFISTSFFDFLPPELLTLFIGGFAVALGLWVFKR